MNNSALPSFFRRKAVFLFLLATIMKGVTMYRLLNLISLYAAAAVFLLAVFLKEVFYG